MEYFEKELAELREDLLRMGQEATHGIIDANEALAEMNAGLAGEVIKHDRVINELETGITNRAIGLLATRQPVAGDLRFLTSCLRLASELERVGDHATNIAEEVIFMTQGLNVRHGKAE